MWGVLCAQCNDPGGHYYWDGGTPNVHESKIIYIYMYILYIHTNTIYIYICMQNMYVYIYIRIIRIYAKYIYICVYIYTYFCFEFPGRKLRTVQCMFNNAPLLPPTYIPRSGGW